MSIPSVLAITLGDPVGIGPEITAKTLHEFSAQRAFRPVAVGDASALRAGAKAAGINAEVRVIRDFATPPTGSGVLDIYDTGVLGTLAPGDADLPWGTVDARAGKAAVTAIETATRAAMNQQVAGIVTGPINKEAIWAAGIKHLGHTELLGELTGAKHSDTMFVIRTEKAHHLRIFFATRHLSLRQALDKLTIEGQLDSIRRAVEALQVYGVAKPRLAVAAVNPHGGEGGAFGDEEIRIVTPACEAARAEGLPVFGPIPADSVFHQGIEGRYDGVLSQYHDQGHIASKTYDFHGTISVTVGLPILRTSVDHGTAFDIAGQGKADHGTMRSAYLAAVDYAPFVPQIRAAYLPS